MARASDHQESAQSSAEPQRRVLIVDDEASLREVLGQYLRLEGFLTLEVADGVEALQVAKRTPPDLIILDLMLPGIDGVEVCRRLREMTAAPILMLTARREEADKLDGFQAGADDYVTKPFSPREVVMRVRAIMRRVEVTTVPAMALDDVVRIGSLVISPRTRSVERDGQPVVVTTKEFDLLYFLARRPRQVFTRQQLLDHLWDFTYYGDPSAVTVHIRRLREKVETNPANPRHIKTVWGIGYKFEP
jgi:DNA-binding response OmpR family regulator